VLAVAAPPTAVEGGLVDPGAGLAPDIEVADRLGGRLELDVGSVVMPAAFAAAALGQRPADLEAVAVLMAFLPGDLHAGGQVHLDGHVGHSAGPCWSRWDRILIDPQRLPEDQAVMIIPEGGLDKRQETPCLALGRTTWFAGPSELVS
jgi:hypothetical protein